MQQLVGNRWFALAELLVVFAYGAVVTIWPQLGGWLVVLVLLPWLIRIVSGRVAFKKSAFIVPMALIVITAGIGVWAAYDQQAAWGKFWIIIGAVAVCIALVNQPRANLGVITSLVGLMGVIIAIIFIMNNEWNTQSSDLDVINRAGGWIMANRPSIGSLSLSPNIAGGLLAILVPIPFALGLFSWKKGDRAKAILSLAMGMVVLIGLFLTSSRGAWIAFRHGCVGAVEIKRLFVSEDKSTISTCFHPSLITPSHSSFMGDRDFSRRSCWTSRSTTGISQWRKSSRPGGKYC